jgi:tRNA G18 (ribose-2'-O)-methylase SpoU
VAALRRLKSKGRRIVALEDDPRASPLKISVPGRFSERLLFIVGNEITGVDPGLLDLCDEIVFIPMQGHKKSYNAAVAFGIAAFMLSNFL